MVHHRGMIEEIEIYGDSQKKQRDMVFWLSQEFSVAKTPRPAGYQRSTKIDTKGMVKTQSADCLVNGIAFFLKDSSDIVRNK